MSTRYPGQQPPSTDGDLAWLGCLLALVSAAAVILAGAGLLGAA